MQVIGIVAEYNPFHTGHAYQIARTRQALEENCAVVAVMSGNWVQGGRPAVLDKWTRAHPGVRGETAPVCGGRDALCRGQTGGGGQPAGGGAVPFALPAKQQSGGGVPADTGQPKQQDPAYDRPQGGSPT